MFDEIVEEVFAVLWKFEPAAAVYLGRHEYDGKVPDWSSAAVAEVAQSLRELAQRLNAREGLDPDQELDRTQLRFHIEKVQFEINTLRWHQRLPLNWIYALDPDLYVKRTYAPAEVRADAVVRLLESANAFLATARQELDPVLPETYCEWSMRAARGAAELIANDVVPAFADLPADIAERLAAAVASASEALTGFAAWIEAERLPGADHGYAIGRAQLETMVEVGEMLSIDLDALLAMAERDLEANLDAFQQVAADIDPDVSPREVYDRYVASVHAEPDELVEQTADTLESIRAFLVEQDIITIPSEVRCRVAETPKHLRWAFAMMDTPGPYENEATEAYYYVTPVEPSWSEREADEWLRALNKFALEDISIHEAYPGHYVHFLHAHNAPTEVSKRLSSYAFVEGWAHYTEQMMWEQGYREGDPRFRLAQLSEALIRNSRFVCAIRLHAHGMTVDEATQFFVDNAFLQELPARKEAERGTFDPGYYSYTLGKLQILDLRRDFRAGRGRDCTIKEFHDALLSRGAPPVAIMRQALLGSHD